MRNRYATMALLVCAISRFCNGETFEEFSARYVDEFAVFSPVGATGLGDHRFDDRLDDVSAAGRDRTRAWLQAMRRAADRFDRRLLDPAQQVDLTLLQHKLRQRLWELDHLREWAWNPLVYTGISGTALYDLMARDFAPAEQRVASAVRRLEQFPRFFVQVRATLEPAQVPRVHAETAIAQNKGVLQVMKHLLRPLAASLSPAEQVRVENAIGIATVAIEEHGQWLRDELLPQALGDFRLGAKRYDEKLTLLLHTNRSRIEIRRQAEQQVQDLHQRMFELAAPINRAAGRQVDSSPSPAHLRDVIRFALEQAYQDTPSADGLVAAAQRSAERATTFLRERELISLMPDPLEIILMPEFRRGVSVAYCDSPGPLDVGQKTYYVVSPLPQDWTPEQRHSFLREYNLRSLDVLTIHEALPGHFLQIAHANRYPGTLRHLFRSGVFIEGWACYTEWMMCQAGFREGDLLMKLVTLKWYLRDATNALLDSAVHVDGISRAEAMRLLQEDAFQEEREAAGKWRRAQLTSAQLSTYFTGYLDHQALRREAEQRWGAKFELKKYHDQVLSYGAPPPQFVRALLFDLPVPVVGE